MKKNTSSIKRITRAALVAALYALLSYLSAPLQFAGFQFRIPEALLVLPIFMPESVIGLYIGAMIANYITGCMVLDIIFGAIATLIGAVGAYLCRRLPRRLLWISVIPNIVSNTVIVPFICMFVYGAPESYGFLALTVLVGEIITCGILGSLLLYALDKKRSIFKL